MATAPKLDDDLTRQINDLADRYARSPQAILREAVADFANRQDEAEERRYHEAMEGWEEYKRTGLHITGEEFFEWASRLGTDRETELPECHT